MRQFILATTVGEDSYNEKRYQTSDGIEDSKQTNGIRVLCAAKAIEAAVREGLLGGDPATMASDLICNILHYVHSHGETPHTIILRSYEAFEAEAGFLEDKRLD